MQQCTNAARPQATTGSQGPHEKRRLWFTHDAGATFTTKDPFIVSSYGFPPFSFYLPNRIG